jgi:hypothetical protein
MNARKVSREPYRIGRSRREIWTAVGVAVAIVLVTALLVWILAPGDDSPAPTVTPSITTPAGSSVTSLPATTETTVASEATTGTTGG